MLKGLRLDRGTDATRYHFAHRLKESLCVILFQTVQNYCWGSYGLRWVGAGSRLLHGSEVALAPLDNFSISFPSFLTAIPGG